MFGIIIIKHKAYAEKAALELGCRPYSPYPFLEFGSMKNGANMFEFHKDHRSISNHLGDMCAKRQQPC